MSDEFAFPIDQSTLTAIARRQDRFFGHAIEVVVHEASGAVLGHLEFCCHPEFEGFERCQALSTDELLAIVKQRISAAVETSREWFRQGLQTIIFPLNGPEASFKAPIAEAVDAQSIVSVR